MIIKKPRLHPAVAIPVVETHQTGKDATPSVVNYVDGRTNGLRSARDR